MGKKAKVLLGLVVGAVVLVGAALAVAEWQLKPAQLTPRVNGLLKDAGFGGSIAEVGAGLDGAFRVSGVDLTLEDGTRVKAELVTGEAEVLPLLGGKVRLATLEVKGIDVKLGSEGRGMKKEKQDEGGRKGTKVRWVPFVFRSSFFVYAKGIQSASRSSNLS